MAGLREKCTLVLSTTDQEVHDDCGLGHAGAMRPQEGVAMFPASIHSDCV